MFSKVTAALYTIARKHWKQDYLLISCGSIAVSCIYIKKIVEQKSEKSSLHRMKKTSKSENSTYKILFTVNCIYTYKVEHIIHICNAAFNAR